MISNQSRVPEIWAIRKGVTIVSDVCYEDSIDERKRELYIEGQGNSIIRVVQAKKVFTEQGGREGK